VTLASTRIGARGPAAFLPVEPVDEIDARRLALFPQQDKEPPVTEPAAPIGEIAQTDTQPGIARPP